MFDFGLGGHQLGLGRRAVEQLAQIGLLHTSLGHAAHARVPADLQAITIAVPRLRPA
ncbi:hypothetical protein OG809_20535 [Kribbella soli]